MKLSGFTQDAIRGANIHEARKAADLLKPVHQVGARLTRIAGQYAQGAEPKLDQMMMKDGLYNLGWRIDHDASSQVGMVVRNIFNDQVRIAYKDVGGVEGLGAYIGQAPLQSAGAAAGAAIGGPVVDKLTNIGLDKVVGQITGGAAGKEVGEQVGKHVMDHLMKKNITAARAQLEAVIMKYDKLPDQLHGYASGGAKAIQLGDQFEIPSMTYNPVFNNAIKADGPAHEVVRVVDDVFSGGFDMFKNDRVIEMQKLTGRDPMNLDRFKLTNVSRQEGQFSNEIGNFTNVGRNVESEIEAAMRDQLNLRNLNADIRQYFEALDKAGNSGRWAGRFDAGDPGFDMAEFVNDSPEVIAARFTPEFADHLRNMSPEERVQILREIQAQGDANAALVNKLSAPHQQDAGMNLLERFRSIPGMKVAVNVVLGLGVAWVVDTFAPKVVQQWEHRNLVEKPIVGILAAFVMGTSVLVGGVHAFVGAAVGPVLNEAAYKGLMHIGVPDAVAQIGAAGIAGAGVAIAGALAVAAIEVAAGIKAGGVIGAAGGPMGLLFGAGIGALVGAGIALAGLAIGYFTDKDEPLPPVEEEDEELEEEPVAEEENPFKNAFGG